MRKRWWVRIALTSEADAWSSPFGPYLTQREALRHGRRIGSHRYAVRAEKIVPPSQRELLEQTVALLTEMRDQQRRINGRAYKRHDASALGPS